MDLAHRFCIGRTLCIATIAWAVAAPTAYGQAGSVPSTEDSFQQSIKPILTRNCVGCHVSGGHAGGLRMDSLSALMKGGDNGPIVFLAILPSHFANVERIYYQSN